MANDFIEELLHKTPVFISTENGNVKVTIPNRAADQQEIVLGTKITIEGLKDFAQGKPSEDFEGHSQTWIIQVHGDMELAMHVSYVLGFGQFFLVSEIEEYRTKARNFNAEVKEEA